MTRQEQNQRRSMLRSLSYTEMMNTGQQRLSDHQIEELQESGVLQRPPQQLEAQKLESECAESLSD